MSVIEWVLVDRLGKGEVLTSAHNFEMIASTVFKVTNRVRQIVAARNQRGLPSEQLTILDDTLAKERVQMKNLFVVLEDALGGIANGNADAMVESGGEDEKNEALLRDWGRKWLRVFRRKLAIEEAWIQETLAGISADETARNDDVVVENGDGD